ncbi:hypothetical protein Leryth_001213 [Lithospermum erythrorhizon]|nr:hypothetical protein Leryth_001213 [Lithospermum erythrorhizon]
MDMLEVEGAKKENAKVEAGIPLVLELSEHDTLFEKKKKLLENVRFSPNKPVWLKSSFSHRHLKCVLDLLLQEARIICSNEVELYFSELDAATHPLGFSSSRNELEALHFIISVIDKVQTTGQHIMVRILEDLRDSTVKMIHEVGSGVADSTKIVPESICEKEKNLLQWGERNGVRRKIDITYVEAAGRGAIATEGLNINDIVLEIPVSIVISEELVRDSDMLPILEKIDGLSPETMLLLWSMKEKHDQNSKHKLYFDTLPQSFDTGLSFGVDAVMALDGTLLLEEIIQAKEHLRTQYDKLFPALCINHPDIFHPEMYTWEHFLWACELWYTNSMKIMFKDGHLRTCLVPIAGFLNHSTCPHILHYSKVDSATNTLKFRLSRPCSAGDQIFLSYGKLSSSHLLTFYGFLPQGDNPYDIIPLDIEVAQDEGYENGDPFSSWSTHMLRGTWLSKTHGIYHYGLPYPLLAYLRQIRGVILTRNALTQENLEVDLETLADLSSTFESMMEALGESTLDDRETVSWDVKLALDFKSLHKKIIASILASCAAGCELIQNELRNLTT